MKLAFSVEMADLKKAVNFSRNGLGVSKTDLAVVLFRFQLKASELTLFADDKEIYAESKVPIVNQGEDGAFAVVGAKIEKLITQVSAEVVRFSVDEENVEVKAGFLTVNFELYDELTLKTKQANLDQERTKTEGGFSIPRIALEEGLVCAKSCTVANSIRPDVTHAEMRKGRILSSDGRKIMIFAHKALPEGAGLKVPAVGLAGVIGALKNGETENWKLVEGPFYYHIFSEDGKWACGVRKIERTFPQVEQMIVSGPAPTDEITVDKVMLE